MTNLTERKDTLKKAITIVQELNVPEVLKAASLEYLLQAPRENSKQTQVEQPDAPTKDSTGKRIDPLREFINQSAPRSAMEAIPCIFYWMRENEQCNEINEDLLHRLLVRSGVRPPKGTLQAMRDLSSLKYHRLEHVEGKKGFYKLSRAGETFVLYDVLQKQSSAA